MLRPALSHAPLTLSEFFTGESQLFPPPVHWLAGSFEYSLVSGINDGKEDAKSLSKLLKGRQCHVNLIPVNEIKENTLKRPSKKTIEEFEKIVNENGIEVTVRREMGNDINAACGQLRRNFLKSQN